ncbi:biofilm regulation protein phosphatase SiaA [Solimonas flava]|uniref:biofilm regulation protein phosphatase SiaA n=1 Tax=Solimonas flava TaxID=415849 RepID=UPI000414953E|nr:biofilm regulation protein phosphatase SiaA [Solimonas flava]
MIASDYGQPPARVPPDETARRPTDAGPPSPPADGPRPRRRLGLRGRSALALALCVLVVLALALAAGLAALQAMERSQGLALSRSTTEYNKLRIVAPVAQELALAQRFADSEITRAWLRDEDDPHKRAMFFAEAERYRRAFADHSYFIASERSHRYWFNDGRTAFSDQPRYVLDAARSEYGWYFTLIAAPRDADLNVDFNPGLGLFKVWINLVIRDGTRVLGAAGTGLDLTTFIRHLTEGAAAGVTPMLLATDGSIQAHPDRRLIADGSGTGTRMLHRSIDTLLDSDADRATLHAAIAAAVAAPDAIQSVEVRLDGRRQLVSLAYAPDLHWLVTTAVDPAAARVVTTRQWLPLALAGLLLLALLMLAIIVAVHRIVLRPLLQLTASARRLGRGDYALELPEHGHDEIGELTTAFASMAARIREHTTMLEARVAARTRELSELNEQMAIASRKLDDSLQYARLIQDAILPGRALGERLGERHFVLWRPRDVVGGDFYVFQADADGFLIGIIDCAGHGVPGALMTMIAHTALGIAVDELGLRDPAALLQRLDERVRAMLAAAGDARIATRMDAGLAYVDLRGRRLRFAGAKTSLYRSDGRSVDELRGDRRAVGDRHRVAFSNHECALAPYHYFYLCSDGLLDQAGGPRGYSFGSDAFRDALLAEAGQPLAAQRAALVAALEAWQGGRPQRDDITVLGFAAPDAPFPPSASRDDAHES